MAMLFMQLATAAYACPQVEKVQQDLAMAAAMPDCNGMPAQMDDDQPQLCKAHCDRDAQGTASAVVPDLQPNPAAVTLLMGIIEPVPPLLPASFAAGVAAGLPRPPGAPPLYLALLVLRN
jgi:hypothetical protein